MSDFRGAAPTGKAPGAGGLAAASAEGGGESGRGKAGAWPVFLLASMVLLIACAGLAFRWQRLDQRPFHSDEAVQAVKAGELYDGGSYQYDPFEFHGPSLYYFTLPVLKLRGADSFADAGDADFRLVPVLFGAGLIVLLMMMARGLGPVATLTAAGLLAVSPAMVYFSRYYIQELPLVFFGALALGALWRYFRAPGVRWCLLLGGAAGMMYATKETSVIFCAAMAAAYGWLVLRRRLREGRPLWLLSRRNTCHLLLALSAAVAVAVVFYSSFFTNPRGPLDSLLAFRHYLGRSGGDGSVALHQHPWYYYLKMLLYTKDAPGPWWSEGLILALAAVGIVVSIRGRAGGRIDPELAVFLAVYTICMTAAFSLIPYKTPWNMLGFLHGLVLMAGIGAGWMIGRFRRTGVRVMLMAALLAAGGQLAAQAWRAAFRFAADPRNPYAYAHPVPDVLRLAERIGEIAALHPDGLAMRVHFITPDYWPLPYYLRKMRQVGYWNDIPAAPDAPVIVAGADLQERLEPRLRDRYHTGFFGLRPDVLLVIHIRQDLWEQYLQSRQTKTERNLRQSG